MRKWPKLNRLIDVEAAIKPLVKWWLAHMRFKPNNRYTGYELTKPINHICLQPDEVLSKEGLEREYEQGRSPITALLTIAFQLGYIQGYRMRQNEEQGMNEINEIVARAKETVALAQEKSNVE